jgi:hypothetical protein
VNVIKDMPSFSVTGVLTGIIEVRKIVTTPYPLCTFSTHRRHCSEARSHKLVAGEDLSF